ncbi:hypothetical protein D9756_002468 [Leucocoprinus leucothites]|uniref:Peptidase M20 dimerisation domain-containing protein n=1 Tax=Leucocoprinus leucothites TaxID=201217 RepID=A0A8H5GBT9_9AGAR|nr:hypothetical protein D9756_002468 [Leucoagaricus leucothites]
MDGDPKWDMYGDFQEYLEKASPLVYGPGALNTYGLIYEWKGSSPTMKPILLAAHQGTRIWGRGSSDDKSPLIGTLLPYHRTTIETLVVNDFQPTCTVVFASGFDEEIGGTRNGHNWSVLRVSHIIIARTLEELYGKNSFAFIIDEGGVFGIQYGTPFAVPAIAGVGSMNAQVRVATPGGHSNIPPDHTSIGMLAAMLVKYEDDPFKIDPNRRRPVYTTL